MSTFDAFCESWASICTLEVFQSWFGILLAISFARTYRPLTEFYAWFSSSGLELAKYRGYGQTACRFYGIFSAPALTLVQMRVVGIVLICALVGIGACPLVARLSLGGEREDILSDTVRAVNETITIIDADVAVYAILAGLNASALIASHLYVSQLYCEAHIGAHVTVLIPPTLVLMALYNLGRIELELSFRSQVFSMLTVGNSLPDSQFLRNRQAACQELEVIFALLLKLLILTAYGSAGASKILESFHKRWNWMNGSSLQGSIFESLWLSDCGQGDRAENERRKLGGLRGMGSPGPHVPHWTFGLPTPYSNVMQRAMLDKPRLLCAASIAAVLLEACAPVILLAHLKVLSPWSSMIFGILGVGLHGGILYLQNVDFLSWWIPCYIFFFDPLVQYDTNYSLSLMQFCPYALSVGVLYVLIHQVAHIFLRVNGGSALPFSAFKMFCDIKDLFHPEAEKVLWLSDKPHATGTLKNYAFPIAGLQHVRPDELDELPFRYLGVRHGGLASIEHTVEDGILKEPLLENKQRKARQIFTNLEMTSDLERALDELEELGRLGQGAWRQSKHVASLLNCVDRLRAAFSAAERRKCSRLLDCDSDPASTHTADHSGSEDLQRMSSPSSSMEGSSISSLP